MDYSVGIIGLGYVGLPLAVESGKYFPTVGYDINLNRIEELENGIDRTLEITRAELEEAKQLTVTNKTEDLKNSNFYIVTVPTPVDESKQPDLRPLRSACQIIGELLTSGDVIVFESTVYPGCTEEVCVPILEKESGLKFNKDFFCGYSPERINPGDKQHRIYDILKVTSGSNEEAAHRIDNFYSKIIKAGTHKAESIKVAEAAKVIENAQRDINIAFVNELSIIFDKLGIDTTHVLKAAGTKWNFLNFSPGLVGGHCIGVDPYYLTHKAEQVGYHPQVILSGRKINDNMGFHVASKIVKLLARRGGLGSDTKVAILGFTFKENCPDVRNTRVIDIYEELTSYGLDVRVYDPEADQQALKEEYDISLISEFVPNNYDAIILAVSHDIFKELDWINIRNQVDVIYDVKGVIDKNLVDERL